MPGADNNDGTDRMPSLLEDAVQQMRAGVAVRLEWRDALLHDLAQEPFPSASPNVERLERNSTAVPEASANRLVLQARQSSPLTRPFAVQPIAAIAACLLAMLAGVAGTLAVTNSNTAVIARSSTDGTAPATTPWNRVGAPRIAGTSQRVVRFALVAPGAASVSIVGDFNGWNPRSTPLAAGADGQTWLVDMPLSAGRHVYAFVVDGDIIADPSAPRVVDHDFGVQNSVVLVGAL